MFLGVKGLGLRVFCIDVFAAFSESCSKKAAKFRHYSMSIGFLFFCPWRSFATHVHRASICNWHAPAADVGFRMPWPISRVRAMCGLSHTQNVFSHASLRMATLGCVGISLRLKIPPMVSEAPSDKERL